MGLKIKELQAFAVLVDAVREDPTRRAELLEAAIFALAEPEPHRMWVSDFSDEVAEAVREIEKQQGG